MLDDGHGMSEDRLHDAMRFGSTSPLAKRSALDLGRFGLGMKTASLSQCRSVTVISKADGTLNACTWDLDRLTDAKVPAWKAVIPDGKTLAKDRVAGPLVEKLDAWKSGTAVIWQTLDAVLSDAAGASSEERFSGVLNQARRHLETVFHRFLASEAGRRAIAMDFNGTPISPFDPFGPLTERLSQPPGLLVEGRVMQDSEQILAGEGEKGVPVENARFGLEERVGAKRRSSISMTSLPSRRKARRGSGGRHGFMPPANDSAEEWQVFV